MSHLVLRNRLRMARGILWSLITGNRKYHMSGIIPGGGLGKLQGMKEEEYFSRQNHKLFENMKKNSNKDKTDEYEVFDYDRTMDENQNLRTCTCSVKHKNLIEEAYFLSDQCECLKILKKKYKNDQDVPEE